ncbi:peptidylprolyl isomerase [Arenicella xantha]|uniref:Peptidyl-prolyl cis-trans isomerase C n=1 Tax=Arenicella xantha TaxID=644221 RepID=A0A395JIJ0_9GAMM|nr:peptidylprolyl isomerase [Arenicella xantha]RBP50596.1 peptidyl-prolyl cis-trans isomerase C [Arenicella xantha]
MSKIACASHILVRTEKDAKSISQQLRKGGDFAALAKKHSTCPSKNKGGDLGEFKKGTMVKQFDNAVFTKGSEDKPFLGPIKTRFGYHLIQVLYKS